MNNCNKTTIAEQKLPTVVNGLTRELLRNAQVGAGRQIHAQFACSVCCSAGMLNVYSVD
jgi:hypothetical protein